MQTMSPHCLIVFSQIIVNIVLATDIMDKELGALRKARWEKAFNNEVTRSGIATACQDDAHTNTNRKATIVLEHLIQVCFHGHLVACMLAV